MLAGSQLQSNRPKSSKSVYSVSKSQNLSETKQKLLPFQRREQLKNLLVVKFMKKYGFRHPEEFLEEEVAKFVVSEKLSEKDLRRLDQKIRSVYEERKLLKSFQYGLTTKNQNNPFNSFITSNQENINKDNISTYSRKSSRSHISNKSQRPVSAMLSGNSFKTGPKLVLQTKKPEPFEKKIGENCFNITNYMKSTLNSTKNHLAFSQDIANMNSKNNLRIETDPNQKNENNEDYNEENENNPNIENNLNNEVKEVQPADVAQNGNDSDNENKLLDRFEFSGGDEWNAIVEYNHKKYEEDIKINRQKDLEVKRRQKEDLDFQMREKLVKKEQERLINREYDNLIDKHLVNMKELENKKEQEVRDKTFILKNNRDKLLQGAIQNKKNQVKKDKVYEKEQCMYIL